MIQAQSTFGSARLRSFSPDMHSRENHQTFTPETSQLRTAHVVFADIVSYSLMATDDQSRAVGQLQSIVRELLGFEQALAADELICLPTGDGMTIVCFGEPTAAGVGGRANPIAFAQICLCVRGCHRSRTVIEIKRNAVPTSVRAA